MSKIRDVIAATDPTLLHLTVDGQAYHLRLEECSLRLANATAAQRAHFEVLPAGYVIHWPEIDEDLAITPLIQKASSEKQGIIQVAEKKTKYGE